MVVIEKSQTHVIDDTEDYKMSYLSNNKHAFSAISYIPTQTDVSGHRMTSGLQREEDDLLQAEFMYHFGIIDYLQVWDMTKICENRLKRVRGLFKDKKDMNYEISAANPILYKDRFQKFLTENVLKLAVENEGMKVSERQFRSNFINNLKKDMNARSMSQLFKFGKQVNN